MTINYYLIKVLNDPNNPNNILEKFCRKISTLISIVPSYILSYNLREKYITKSVHLSFTCHFPTPSLKKTTIFSMNPSFKFKVHLYCDTLIPVSKRLVVRQYQCTNSTMKIASCTYQILEG